MQVTLERLRQRRQEKGDEGGFTLIELLIVIVILGILAAIVVFAVQNLTKTSATAACGSDFKTVETAVEAYKAQEHSYPSDGVGAHPAITFGVVAGDANAINAMLQTDTTINGSVANPVGPWLKDIPFNTGHYQIVVSTDGLGTVSVYTATGAPPANDNTVNGGAQIGATNSPADCATVK